MSPSRVPGAGDGGAKATWPGRRAPGPGAPETPEWGVPENSEWRAPEWGVPEEKSEWRAPESRGPGRGACCLRGAERTLTLRRLEVGGTSSVLQLLLRAGAGEGATMTTAGLLPVRLLALGLARERARWLAPAWRAAHYGRQSASP